MEAATWDNRLRSYTQAVAILGGIILATSLAPPHFTGGSTFPIYLAVVVLSSLIKIRLPGLTTTLSPNVIPILVGITELTFTDSVLLGFAGAVTLYVWHSKVRFGWLRFAFHGAIGVIAAAASGALLPAIQNWKGARGSVAFATLAIAYFVMLNLPICTAAALVRHKRVGTVWRECYVSSFPIFMFGALAAGIYRAGGEYQWMLAIAMSPILFLVYRAYFTLLQKFQQEKDSAVETAALNLRTMEALVGAIEAKDGASSNEVGLVRAYAIETAKQLQLPEEDMKALAAAALLRDIGKMAVPDHLFARSGQLAPAEIERMRSHVSAGAAILKDVRFPYPVLPTIKSHHEKWNGSGYPEGLKGDQIPIGARIIGVVDALVSLSSGRPYRPAIPVEQAMEKIASDAGHAFDPNVVAALQRSYKEVEFSAPRKSSDDSAQTEEDPGNALHFILKAKYEAQILAPTDAALNLKESLAVLAMRLGRVVSHDTIVIHVQTGDRLIPEYVCGDESKFFGLREIPVGHGISGKVAETGKSVLNADPIVELAAIGAERKDSTLHSAISVPIENSRGARGVLTLYRTAKNAFAGDDLRVLLAIRLKVLNCELHSQASAVMRSGLSAVRQPYEESDATKLSNALA
jgi:putative nucleotidyltransferase with HDIG domain